MDIQHLVDRLEEVFNGSFRIPMSAYLLVNEETFDDGKGTSHAIAIWLADVRCAR